MACLCLLFLFLLLLFFFSHSHFQSSIRFTFYWSWLLNYCIFKVDSIFIFWNWRIQNDFPPFYRGKLPAPDTVIVITNSWKYFTSIRAELLWHGERQGDRERKSEMQKVERECYRKNQSGCIDSILMVSLHISAHLNAITWQRFYIIYDFFFFSRFIRLFKWWIYENDYEIWSLSPLFWIHSNWFKCTES